MSQSLVAENEQSDFKAAKSEVETRTVDPWNEEAFIESVRAAGFPGSSMHTDEGFRYHLFNFGSAPLKAEAEPEETQEPAKRSHHKKV